MELSSGQFSKSEICAHEKMLLFKLDWQLRPVTPYEIMAHLVCYAEMEQKLEENILFNAQLAIDFSLCGGMNIYVQCTVCTVCTYIYRYMYMELQYMHMYVTIPSGVLEFH